MLVPVLRNELRKIIENWSFRALVTESTQRNGYCDFAHYYGKSSFFRNAGSTLRPQYLIRGYLIDARLRLSTLNQSL